MGVFAAGVAVKGGGVELQSPRNAVIPAKAGIQTKDVNLVSLVLAFAGMTVFMGHWVIEVLLDIVVF